MTPQLALRVAIVGTCALVMFAVIFFRLWFLQVLTGTQYLAQASTNSQRAISIPSPRGEVIDSSGTPLVISVPVPAVQIAAPDLPVPITVAEMTANYDRPPARDAALYRRLGTILGISNRPTKCHVDGKYAPPNGTSGNFRLSRIACLVAQGVANVPYDDVTIAQDVPKDVQYYLGERQVQYPGVVVVQKYIRQYPQGSIGAQVLGTVGPISKPETKQKHFRGQGIANTDEVGQSGLEWQYNKFLQGKDGQEHVKVNSLGEFEGYARPTQPTPGDTLQVSINEKLQKVGQRALATSIATNNGTGGAFVAMDPQNGQIYAMGSNPTYNPSLFTKPMTQSQYDKYFGPSSGDPLLNRAIQSVGPTGSTFKPITATAALQSGAWSTGETYDDTGCFHEGTICLHNSGQAANGVINMTDAIKVSDDIFFYNLGELLNSDKPQGGALQKWAHKYGIGRSPGVDLPGAATGALPSPSYWNYLNQQEKECEKAIGPYKGHPKHPGIYTGDPGGGGCGIGSGVPWTYGDNVNTAVGQGDVQVSPLQLAVVYSALANGGTIVTPHVGQDIQSGAGTILQRIDPKPRRHLHINPAYLSTILTGLREAASQPGGTSADVMGSFPEQVYGKTGTAQYFTGGVEHDYAWYSCFVPASATSKPIEVTVWVENGGFGDVAAAPVARQILSQWFFNKPGVYKSGISTTL